MPAEQIQYSEKYFDDVYEYRHVILPPDLTKHVPKSNLMTESEWRNLGIQQSPGWIHYMMHAPEPHVILFRRPRTDIPEWKCLMCSGRENKDCHLDANTDTVK